MLLRHVPARDPCSLCAQPPSIPENVFACSNAPVVTRSGQSDAALPFLSFAAGLMTAAEAVKLAMIGPSQLSSSNRVFLQMKGEVLVHAPTTQLSNCICTDRSLDIVLRVAGRFGPLSEPSVRGQK
jgi:hypothetical protein